MAKKKKKLNAEICVEYLYDIYLDEYKLAKEEVDIEDFVCACEDFLADSFREKTFK